MPEPRPPLAQGVVAHDGMVVAQEARAARIGVDILQKGGNAVDAAVAVGFALAVSYPRAGNIGGGGFMVIHRANGDDTAIDYRETAPQRRSTPRVFSMRKAMPIRRNRANPRSPSACRAPSPAWRLAEEKYGSGHFTLADLIAPAIAMARDGVIVDRRHRGYAAQRAGAAGALAVLGKDFPQARRRRALRRRSCWSRATLPIRLRPSRATARALSTEGPIAEKLAAAVQAAGGVMTVDDLKDYRAIERAPVRGTYRGYEIVSMPPPSSGGVELIEMLNILEGYDLAHDDEAQTLHLMIEAMKRAYADRALFLGDPDKVKVPVARLIAKRLRRGLARHHRSRARDAGERHSRRRQCRTRRPQHHAFLRRRPFRQRRRPIPTRSISAMASGWWPREPAFS